MDGIGFASDKIVYIPRQFYEIDLRNQPNCTYFDSAFELIAFIERIFGTPLAVSEWAESDRGEWNDATS